MGGRRWSSGADRAHWFLSSLTPREREFNLNPYLFYLLDREGRREPKQHCIIKGINTPTVYWNIPAVALDPLRKLTYFTTKGMYNVLYFTLLMYFLYSFIIFYYQVSLSAIFPFYYCHYFIYYYSFSTGSSWSIITDWSTRKDRDEM